MGLNAEDAEVGAQRSLRREERPATVVRPYKCKKAA